MVRFEKPFGWKNRRRVIHFGEYRSETMHNPIRNYFRRAGHRHREERRWAQATSAYAWHVRFHPGDILDWIRLAESALAAGRLDVSNRAYIRAFERAPHDRHIAFQLAKSLLRTGRVEEAELMFQRSLQLAERDVPSAAVDPPGDVVNLLQGATLYSVQDLMGYLLNHPTVTGIQRVQIGIVRHVLSRRDHDAAFVLTDAETGIARGDFWLLDAASLLDVLDEAESIKVDHELLKKRIRHCRNSARPVRPGAGHTLILLGAFWALGNSPLCYLAAKRRGARIGAYIYDLIPLTHPQFCEIDLILHFKVGFGQLVAIADFILTISEDTAESVRTLLSVHHCTPIAVQAIPLASTAEHGGDRTSQDLLPSKPFVAYVSTIEARKNHLYIFRIWQSLIEQGVEVPDLIFVGRLGWRVGPLSAALHDTDNLNGRIRLVHNLSDRQLDAVYSHANFTVFTSFVEGWGLPIGESLAHGTPCVASRSSSMPEVAGELADYVDPYDIDDGIKTIRRLVTDPDYLARRRRQITDHFVARTWDDVGADFVRAVAQHAAADSRPIREAQLVAGYVYAPGKFTFNEFDLDTLIKSPRGLLLADGFEPADDNGAAIRGKDATIRLSSNLSPETPVRLTIALYRVRQEGAGEVVVTSSLGQCIGCPLDNLPCAIDKPLEIHLNDQVNENGTIAVTVSVDGRSGDQNTVGLAYLSYRPLVD